MLGDTIESLAWEILGNITVSVDFNISYFLTTKINVEIEAKVLGHNGKFSSNMVFIRNKVNGELIAVRKQWMSAFDLKHRSKL
ncbi:hypothetical protein MKX01_037128 [Papaver californicum]|nr:hypothetical protein MKX01_037128 [Papaver californicum]